MLKLQSFGEQYDALLESYKINKGSRCNTLFFSHQLFTAFQTDTVIWHEEDPHNDRAP